MCDPCNVDLVSPEARPAVPFHAQKMEVIGRLSSAIIHDLNNLLTVIQLNAALLEGGGFEADEVAEIAQKISQASQRASDLTRKVLSFARSKASEPQTFEIGELFRGMVRLLEPLVSKRAQIDMRPGDLPCRVLGDRSAIELAVLNLVLNAAESMADGGRVTLSCEPRRRDDADYVLIRVVDQGNGIPEEDRARLFEPFFTKKATGTGLGLSIVANIAAEHRGIVDFESTVGVGTEFRLWLPAAPAEPGVAPVPIPVVDAPLSGTILLVEDDPGIRALSRQLLTNAGMTVVEAANGPEALAAFDQHRDEVRVLFTDLVLPGTMSGRDLAVALLERSPQLAVLYTSGFSSAWNDATFFNENNFLPKPFHPAELRQAVRRVLSLRAS